MENERAAGVLCHISSLPGKYGIGSLGKEAYRFASRLASVGVKYWQVLPLVQTGFGDSPYQSVSCHSGNPYFIDLEELAKQGLLGKEDLRRAARSGDVDYGALYAERYALLRKAFAKFHFDGYDFRAFVKTGRAEDYALFMTAKTVYGGSFADWEEPLKRRDPDALEKLRTDYHEEYLFWQFLQYEFWGQWDALHAYCKELGLRIIGDIPLYVAYDSADVWANPALFKLDKDLKPAKVAGVPPDYFSETGQLWGNPVYNWEAHRADGFAWWTNRLKAALTAYDLVRIDHFRGIDRYYEIDAGAETAAKGTWREGPKEVLFSNLSQRERESIIAEDLGTLDGGVRSLLARTGFPGMKVLLFAFDGNEKNEYLPKRIEENSVVYTGTHDNATVEGYVEGLSPEEYILFRSRVAQALEDGGIALKLDAQGKNLPDALIRLALSSRAALAVIPVQDVLGLDNAARMNRPGTGDGNWRFRLTRIPSQYELKHLKTMIKTYRR